MGVIPPYAPDAKDFAKHIRATKPGAKIGIFYQSDDFGEDDLKCVLDAVGGKDKAKGMVVSQLSYGVTAPTIDSQLVTLKGAGDDTFINITTPKFAAQAIKKAAETGWKPAHCLVSVSTSVTSVLKPAGFETVQGIISSMYLRDPSGPSQHATNEYQDHAALMKKCDPTDDVPTSLNANGHVIAMTTVEVLQRAGDNLTRDNILKITANRDLATPMLSAGIKVKTTPADFQAVGQSRLIRFASRRFEPFGGVIDGN